MHYKVLYKDPQIVVWHDPITDDLIFTGILSEIAQVPRTFIMNPDEIDGFKKVGGRYLQDLRIRFEGHYELWKPRLVEGFDKDPERLAIIEERSYSPSPKPPGFWSRLFGAD